MSIYFNVLNKYKYVYMYNVLNMYIYFKNVVLTLFCNLNCINYIDVYVCDE